MSTIESTRPSIEERYSGAVNTRNLKVERDADRSNVADILIAAGWSRGRCGTALMRLQSEWDGSAKPRPLSAAAVKVLAGTFAKDRPMVLSEKGATEWPQWRATVQAHDWHMHELGLLFQRLKTLAEVREQLGTFAFVKGMESAHVKAAAVIAWWLHHTCAACNGLGYELVPGTDRRSNRLCKTCKGSCSTKVPFGIEGSALVAEIEVALHQAVSSMGASMSNRTRLNVKLRP